MNKNTLEGFVLDIVLHDIREKKKTYRCPCLVPIDSLNMSKEEINKAYGQHLSNAFYDLLHHAPFRKGLDKPKLILSS